MKSRSKRKLITYLIVFAAIFIGYILVIRAFEENIIYFVTPSEIKPKHLEGRAIRIGGVVKDESVANNKDMNWKFVITDNKAEIEVQYRGVMPSLFREGQGIIAKGEIKQGVFMATEVLAKHDEKYMPKSVADELKKKGYWK